MNTIDSGPESQSLSANENDALFGVAGEATDEMLLKRGAEQIADEMHESIFIYC